MALARHGLALAGKRLDPETLLRLEAELEGALHLTFFLGELMGRAQAGTASPKQARLLRLLAPVAKIFIATQAAQVLSEAIDSFSDADRARDAALAALLRDAGALRIREDAAGALPPDELRALVDAGCMAVLRREAGFLLQGVRAPELLRGSAVAEQGLEHAAAWLAKALPAGAAALEAGAPRFATTVGRAVELALLARHAQWSLDHGQDRRALAVARRFAARGLQEKN